MIITVTLFGKNIWFFFFGEGGTYLVYLVLSLILQVDPIGCQVSLTPAPSQLTSHYFPKFAASFGSVPGKQVIQSDLDWLGRYYAKGPINGWDGGGIHSENHEKCLPYHDF